MDQEARTERFASRTERVDTARAVYRATFSLFMPMGCARRHALTDAARDCANAREVLEQVTPSYPEVIVALVSVGGGAPMPSATGNSVGRFIRRFPGEHTISQHSRIG